MPFGVTLLIVAVCFAIIVFMTASFSPAGKKGTTAKAVRQNSMDFLKKNNPFKRDGLFNSIGKGVSKLIPKDKSTEEGSSVPEKVDSPEGGSTTTGIVYDQSCRDLRPGDKVNGQYVSFVVTPTEDGMIVSHPLLDPDVTYY